MSLVRAVYNSVDRRIVSSLEGRRINGKFIFPKVEPQKREEFFIKEYFSTQPSVLREMVLFAYLHLRDSTHRSLKNIYRSARRLAR